MDKECEKFWHPTRPEHWRQLAKKKTASCLATNSVVCVKCSSGLERPVMQGVAAGRRGRGYPAQRWTQGIVDNLGMRVHEARELVNQLSHFRWAAMRTILCKGPSRWF